MPNRLTAKRSRTRRAGESAFGFLLLVKQVVLVLVAVVLVCAGVWTSWGTAVTAMKGADRGTLKVAECGAETCWGPFTPSGGGQPRGKVSLSSTVSGEPGERLDVALRPDAGGGGSPEGGANDGSGSGGSDSGGGSGTQAVRTGAAGILYAWVPLAGSLLLAALVVAGGLRMRRTGWALGVLGAATMAAAWALLHF